MILIDIFVVLFKLFALIKFIETYDCDVNSHLFFFFRHFRRNSAKFSAKCLFGKVAFRQNGFSAKWFSAKCRASFCSHYYPVMTLTYLQNQMLQLRLFIHEKATMMEIFAACGLEIG